MGQHHKRAHEGAFYRDLGHNLRLTRCAAGKTQIEIAAHLDITYQQIQKYEAGTNRIPLDRMVRLAAFLEVPLSHFLSPTDASDGGSALRSSP